MMPDGTTATTLGELGEREVIRRLARLVGAPPSPGVGMGDDCAVVSAGDSAWDLVLTSDPLIEGRHFRPEDDAEGIGRKAVGRVLSDLAAMGADPLWLLIDVVAPPSLAVARLESAYRGAVALAARFGAAIVGGDTASGGAFELHGFGVGRVPRGAAVLRSGARAGDALYVTGELGGSALGRHLRIEPRIEQGRWLREGGWAAAMMDLSDGLASDLRRILELQPVGAVLRADRLPVSDDARRAGGDAVERALRDGEDYELLFSVRPNRAPAFEAAWRGAFALRCTRIGDLTGEAGVLRLSEGPGPGRVYSAGGYEHFTAS
jgi:thiamine-monophosphate kinase